MRFLLLALGIFFFSEGNCSDSVSVFAILDLKKVASESLAGKDIEQQIEAANKEARKDLEDLEHTIKSMESSKKPDYDARKIEDMQLILYDMVRKKKYQISEAYRRAISILDGEMKKTIEKICAKAGIKLVVNSEAVIYMTKGCKNITNEVIQELNKVCKNVKVDLKELQESK
ncbi:MAG: OmpH family outer membrane protein [Holosporaceae bacterium]|jgi:Skp family chaperone for outer membrane proteins|nr:OmpH family outer membrane protein [Holosporaceae bacterium]